MRSDEPPSPQAITADSELTLSLLNLRAISSLNDIRPFDLEKELAEFERIAGEMGQFFPSQAQGSSDRNLKQMALALMMYAQDYDEVYPVVDHTTGYDWWMPLQSYVKNAQVFRCPAYRADPTTEPATDYLLNGLFAHGTSMALFQDTSTQIAIAIRKPGGPWTGYHPWPDDGTSWDNLSAYSEFEGHIATTIHNDGSNYGFADGHAKWMRWEKTIEAPIPGTHNTGRWAL